jgi:hypothetical protein
MAKLPFARRLVRRLNRIANARPALGLRLAALSGFVLGPRLGSAWWPSVAELEELLGAFEERNPRPVQRRIAAGELRNRAIMYMMKNTGPALLAGLIRVRGAEVIQRLRDEEVPVVIVFWHAGVIRSLETALTGLGYSLLVSASQPPRGSDPGYGWHLVTDRASGAHFVMEALKALQRGVLPVLALDGPSPKSDRVPFFGRSIPAPASAALLARRGGARIVPATSRWIGLSPRIEVTLHEPMVTPELRGCVPAAWDRETMERLLTWFEGYMRAHPQDLRPVSIRHLLKRLRDHARAPSDRDFALLVEEFQAADAD